MTYTIAQIASAIGTEPLGDRTVTVDGAAEPQSAGPADLAIAVAPGFVELIGQGRARAALLPEGVDWRALGLAAAVVVPQGRLAMAHVTALMDKGPDLPTERHRTAIVETGAELAADVAIGAYSIVGPEAVIGAGTRMGVHVSVAAEAVIGPGCHIHDGVRIGRGCRIGPGCVLQPNVVIGADGFSFVTEAPGRADAARSGLAQRASAETGQQTWEKIHSLGGVEIGADVEIGAGSTVDAGTIRATRVGRGTKIDNLVQIGHNVIIGEDCLICAQAGVAGSSRIGDRSVLAGKSGVSDNVTVGADVVLAGGSIALSNVPTGRVMMGYPAVRIERHLESYRAIRRLPRLFDRFRRIEKQVPKIGRND